ncbi:MAG: RidA family protein [Ignavibacteriaceae bacterium]|nr:RidA family protein [Ignavibacteriaceae bacterium]
MIEEKIINLGFTLPEAPKPLASYIPALAVNNLVFTAGQLPLKNGVLLFKGKLGKDVTDDEGKQAAQQCILNCLSVVKNEIGSLDNIDKIIKLTVFVNSAEGFINHPQVANGASDLIRSIFGENGKHVRSAVGVAELPLDAPVEIEMVCKTI